jgi:hypothetical protein
MKYCRSCNGRKKVMQLGLMELDCTVCKGTGNPPIEYNSAGLTNPYPDPLTDGNLSKKRGKPVKGAHAE